VLMSHAVMANQPRWFSWYGFLEQSRRRPAFILEIPGRPDAAKTAGNPRLLPL